MQFVIFARPANINNLHVVFAHLLRQFIGLNAGQGLMRPVFDDIATGDTLHIIYPNCPQRGQQGRNLGRVRHNQMHGFVKFNKPADIGAEKIVAGWHADGAWNVGIGKGSAVTQVEHLLASRQRRVNVGAGAYLESRQIFEQGRAIFVNKFHTGEVFGRLRLARQQPIDEGLFIVDLKGWAKKLFVAKCGGWDCAQGFATRAACTMPRPNLQIIGQLLEAL